MRLFADDEFRLKSYSSSRRILENTLDRLGLLRRVRFYIMWRRLSGVNKVKSDLITLWYTNNTWKIFDKLRCISAAATPCMYNTQGNEVYSLPHGFMYIHGWHRPATTTSKVTRWQTRFRVGRIRWLMFQLRRVAYRQQRISVTRKTASTTTKTTHRSRGFALYINIDTGR